MRKEYDFSKARPSPYAKRLKRSTTVRIDHSQRRRRPLGGPAPLFALVREGVNAPRRIRPAWRTLVSNS